MGCRRLLLSVLAFVLCCDACVELPVQPKVFVITMFNLEANEWFGNPEFDFTDCQIPIPGLSPLYPSVYCTNDGAACLITTGQAEINAASSISALVYSGRFVLTSTYFLVAGIAGISPKRGTIGSVTFARYAVQVGLQYEIDAREMPANFSTGYFAQGSAAPGQVPGWWDGSEVFELNGALQELAFAYGQTAELTDSTAAQAARAPYRSGYAQGAAGPTVVSCDTATSDTYWTGDLLASMVEDTEDNGTLNALFRAALTGLVDFQRIIVMRAGSDFDRPYSQASPLVNLLGPDPGLETALANLYLVGVEVVEGIIGEWEEKYAAGITPVNYVGDVFGSLGSSPPPAGVLVKRARATPPPSNQIAISSDGDKNKGLIRTVQRTSSLEAPIISLAGAHGGEILSCRFDPTGQNIAACSADRSVSLWRTYPPNNNYGLLSSLTKAPIIDLQWSLCSPTIYTVSADHTLITTDVTTGRRVRKIRAHREIVNAVDRTMAGGSGTELVVTGADDGIVKVWDGGEDGGKDPVAQFEVGCPVTAVCWSADGASVYAAALDNEIHMYDLRKGTQLSTLTGHVDTPTSLALSPNGSFLLSPSFSSQVIIHDVRPFSPSPNRIHRVLTGAPAGFEHTLLRGAWSRSDDGARVAAGGADRMVCIWEVESSRVIYKLPGHKGTVTAVDFHPKEPIILTGSKDGTMLLGELDPSAGVGS
uniref:WD40 repeat-like protein n=1 Tax=Mycena chlorophos TaxID=658473 RepID=A0ABQ0L336_MYCCL|nr:predicted protein [Mycena chlorophos]